MIITNTGSPWYSLWNTRAIFLIRRAGRRNRNRSRCGGDATVLDAEAVQRRAVDADRVVPEQQLPVQQEGGTHEERRREAQLCSAVGGNEDLDLQTRLGQGPAGLDRALHGVDLGADIAQVLDDLRREDDVAEAAARAPARRASGSGCCTCPSVCPRSRLRSRGRRLWPCGSSPCIPHRGRRRRRPPGRRHGYRPSSRARRGQRRSWPRSVRRARPRSLP